VQLGIGPTGRQRRVADMGAQIKPRISHPHGPAQAMHARLREPAAKPGQQPDTLVEQLQNLLERRRGLRLQRVEDERATRVHQCTVIRLLKLQERGVERTKTFLGCLHGRPSSID